MSLGDPELLDRWREGDLEAGDELFNRHFASIHRFFRNKVGEEGLEDLVQQTFMACVEGRERFRSDSSFRTYLFGVAHNLLRDFYRRRRKSEAIDFGETSAVDAGAGPSTVVGKRREQRLLLEGLRRIPIDSQVVLELYYWEEMSASQTARVLEIPEGTVRGRVRRAKELLRKELTRLARTQQELESTVGDLERWAASLRDMLVETG
jgi:RNA polymerase sigma-70 factor (ECF subfamily)